MENIIVIVRTLNEEHNIQRFCQSYQWADRILVADGGSDDDTVYVAMNQPKTFVTYFKDRVSMMNNLWRNEAGEHINYLIDWAEACDPDWIILDDCDCVPNKTLRENARSLLKQTSTDIVKAVRLYLWGEDRYLPDLSFMNGSWAASLWAWRPSAKIEFTTNPINHTHELKGKLASRSFTDLELPNCLLHRPWPDEETVKEKMDFYRESGQHPTILHPLKFGGAPKPLPEWAIE